VAVGGERGPAVLESLLGASPREFESSILRRADLQEYRWWPLANAHVARPWAHLVGSFPEPMTCPAAGGRRCCAWSRMPRTGLNGGAHAAGACWRQPFGVEISHRHPSGQLPVPPGGGWMAAVVTAGRGWALDAGKAVLCEMPDGSFCLPVAGSPAQMTPRPSALNRSHV
jgi:hypothetical protein